MREAQGDSGPPAGSDEKPASGAERLRLLLEVSALLAAHRELHTLLREISASLQRLVKHDYASLSLFDRELGGFRLHALDFPSGRGLIREQAVFAAEGSPHAVTIRSGEPLVVNRLDARRFSSDITQWLLSEGIQSACWLPLQHGHRSIGVLNVASFHENALDAEAMLLLREISVLISVAVESREALLSDFAAGFARRALME